MPSISESPIRTEHKFAKPGAYNVTVKVTNPFTEPIYVSKQISAENPVKRKDFHLETQIDDHQNGSKYHKHHNHLSFNNELYYSNYDLKYSTRLRFE